MRSGPDDPQPTRQMRAVIPAIELEPRRLEVEGGKILRRNSL
jgi:hypothetical protein